MCPHGHAYTEENTYRDPRGYRQCRSCRRRRSRQEVSNIRAMRRQLIAAGI